MSLPTDVLIGRELLVRLIEATRVRADQWAEAEEAGEDDLDVFAIVRELVEARPRERASMALGLSQAAETAQAMVDFASPSQNVRGAIVSYFNDNDRVCLQTAEDALFLVIREVMNAAPACDEEDPEK